MTTDLEAIGRHLFDTASTIRGAMNPSVWHSIAGFHNLHNEMGYAGPVAEIGVHHGKFFISLLHTASNSAKSYAIDLFDMQDANLDGSGLGDLSVLKRNVISSGFDEERIVFARRDSLAITQQEIVQILTDNGQFKFFSVDGGHTAEHTINDLRIAMALTDPRGLIVLDDYYNPNWPGVQEGFVRLFTLDTPLFVPILYTSNKLFLCHLSKHEIYLKQIEAYLRHQFPKDKLKKVVRMGYRGLTVLPDNAISDPRLWFARDEVRNAPSFVST